LEPGKLPSAQINEALQEFRATQGITGKGQLAQMLFAARFVRENGVSKTSLSSLLTKGKGQIKGLSKGSVQKVLADYGITKVLAEEGGRTSRGGLASIESFIDFLNDKGLRDSGSLGQVEHWWVLRAGEFFQAKPFRLNFEAGKALHQAIENLLDQAKQRQQAASGTMYVGALLQYLVGAKLELVLKDVDVIHHGFSSADGPTDRGGDYQVGDHVLHVTVAPGESVMRKCQANLNDGLHPIIVTLAPTVPSAFVFADKAGIRAKVEVLDAEQFIVGNLLEIAGFIAKRHRPTLEELLKKYNSIVESVETDKSMRIEY
jgi:hypothetical protein